MQNYFVYIVETQNLSFEYFGIFIGLLSLTVRLHLIYLSIKFSYITGKDLVKHFYKVLIHSPYKLIKDNNNREITAIIANKIDQLVVRFLLPLTRNLQTTAFLVSLIFGLIIHDILITLLGISLLVGLYSIFFSLIKKPNKNWGSQYSLLTTKIIETVNETLTNYKK